MSETPEETTPGEKKQPGAAVRYVGYAAVLLALATLLVSAQADALNVELLMATIFVGFIAIMLRARGSGGASGGVDIGGDGGDGGGGD